MSKQSVTSVKELLGQQQVSSTQGRDRSSGYSATQLLAGHDGLEGYEQVDDLDETLYDDGTPLPLVVGSNADEFMNRAAFRTYQRNMSNYRTSADTFRFGQAEEMTVARKFDDMYIRNDQEARDAMLHHEWIMNHTDR